jgi:hypothetical protein
MEHWNNGIMGLRLDYFLFNIKQYSNIPLFQHSVGKLLVKEVDNMIKGII